MNVYAVDFGTGTSLAVHGPKGPHPVPKLKPRRPARSDAEKFIARLEILLQTGDVVVEAPTIGSSGCEVDDVVALVKRSPHTLYTISNRLVKNYKVTHRIKREDAWSDADSARVLYEKVCEHPARMAPWTAPREKIDRQFTSVRPHDKRGYVDPFVHDMLAHLPPFKDLPAEMKTSMGRVVKKVAQYNPAVVLPFAMAIDETARLGGGRRTFERVLGLYEHGHKSFYRRATVALMKIIAKEQTGHPKDKMVTQAERKRAWKETQRQLRTLFRMRSRGHGTHDAT